jgi:hypothetical protein
MGFQEQRSHRCGAGDIVGQSQFIPASRPRRGHHRRQREKGLAGFLGLY